MPKYYFLLGYDCFNIRTLMYIGNEEDAAHESFYDDYPRDLVFNTDDLEIPIPTNDVYDYLSYRDRSRELGLTSTYSYPENPTPEQITVIDGIKAFEDRLLHLAQGPLQDYII
jgi:hypothetical protein